MNTRKFSTRIGGGLLGLIAALAIGVVFAASAQAQSQDPRMNKDARNSDSADAQRYRDAEMNRGRNPSSPTDSQPNRNLEAKLTLTNTSSNEIKSVLWRVSFIHPTTFAVLETREITSKSKIAPGKEKTLKKTIRIPRPVKVTGLNGKTYAVVPTMTTALDSVTYADGTTSKTP
ncbi:MAG: hypothetical protein QOE77_1899 [Blastocatellia bacterium]|jgi:hypothetical protein|nr:hypothetical protein [Blastocatellia bacterium]